MADLYNMRNVRFTLADLLDFLAEQQAIEGELSPGGSTCNIATRMSPGEGELVDPFCAKNDEDYYQAS